MEKMHENVERSTFSCFHTRKLHQSICFMYFHQLVLTFTPTLHHNGKGSVKIQCSAPVNDYVNLLQRRSEAHRMVCTL